VARKGAKTQRKNFTSEDTEGTEKNNIDVSRKGAKTQRKSKGLKKVTLRT
jgi:hypothetical protein